MHHQAVVENLTASWILTTREIKCGGSETEWSYLISHIFGDTSREHEQCRFSTPRFGDRGMKAAQLVRCGRVVCIPAGDKGGVWDRDRT